MIEQQYFSSLRNQKKQLLNFHKILWVSYKMETQEIINLLNDSSIEESKFATKKWYVIDSETAKGKYKQGDTIKFQKETIKSSLCDYSSNLVRSLEMPLIKCKVYLELNWIEDCILSSAWNYAKFEIADAKLHVPIVILPTK